MTVVERAERNACAGQIGNGDPGTPGPLNMIHDSASGGYLTGTDGADHFIRGAGDDIFDGGSAGYDQVDLDGLVEEWSFIRNADGSVDALHAIYGKDVLKGIDGIWFGDANS